MPHESSNRPLELCTQIFYKWEKLQSWPLKSDLSLSLAQAIPSPSWATWILLPTQLQISLVLTLPPHSPECSSPSPLLGNTSGKRDPSPRRWLSHLFTWELPIQPTLSQKPIQVLPPMVLDRWASTYILAYPVHSTASVLLAPLYSWSTPYVS